ncbi:attacin-A-like [Lucilia sericata]|uniref:attacin-A-like n=1 Tax=Lucilia sericata TaxID=13632 RepID=UPI0018A876DD|nr:attacin-A-like [Lucilia sericata]
MGISFSTNTWGINNINLYGAQKVGNEQIQTLAGLFAHINLDEGPLVQGFFTETNVVGNAVNITYTTISREADNLQGSLRLRLFKQELWALDMNFFHNITNIYNFFKFSRFGGNICWSFPQEGNMLAVGVTYTPLFHTTTLDLICKTNLWKSKNDSFNLDLSTNVTFYIRGPLVGQHNFVASLTLSYDLWHTVLKEKVLTN